MIKTIALDDEPPALKVIEEFCRKVEYIDLQKTFFKTSEAALYLQTYPVDLIFLDIRMPSISGIAFYKQIQQKSMVIFTTAYSEYAVEGFNLNALDYLLKPFTFQRFQQAAEKAATYYQFLNRPESSRQDHLYVRVDYTLVKVTLSNILFIEGLDDYMKIHLENEKPLLVRMTMKALLERLPPGQFIRVHRSYIVPFSRVEGVRNRIIFLAGKEIPISNNYHDQFISALNNR